MLQGETWPSGCDLAWHEGGGDGMGLLTRNRGANVRLLVLPAKDYGEASRMLDERKNDLATSNVDDITGDARFVGVLTDKGQLALVEIRKREPKQIELSWTVLSRSWPATRPGSQPTSQGPREVAEAFLKALAAGEYPQGMRLSDPASATPQQLRTDLPEMVAALDDSGVAMKDLKVERVHGDERSALAATIAYELARRGKKEMAVLQLTLMKNAETRGLWVVTDIDVESPQSAQAELDRFLAEHPKAVAVAASQPATQPAMNVQEVRALVESARGLMMGVYEAMEQNDPDTALMLLRQEIEVGDRLQAAVAGSPVEEGVRAVAQMLSRTEAALVAKKYDQARSLLETLNSIGSPLDVGIRESLKGAGKTPATQPGR